MKKTKWFYWVLIALLSGATQLRAAEETQTTATPTETTTTSEGEATDEDEDWLNTVWTQIDGVVKQEELKLQETVTVAGVRGAEAEDNILDKLYYKGGKRYPSQDKLKKAIETLKKSIADQPKGENAPKQKYFLAQCYEKMGQKVQAKQYYGLVAKDHPQSSFAAKAQKQLAALK
jgi:TolA-binding protein